MGRDATHTMTRVRALTVSGHSRLEHLLLPLLASSLQDPIASLVVLCRQTRGYIQPCMISPTRPTSRKGVLFQMNREVSQLPGENLELSLH